MMQFASTRGEAPHVGLSAALTAGLAPDGGLYVPERLPQRTAADFDGAHTLVAVAERLLAPFFAGDPLEPELPAILREAFDFETELRTLPTPHSYALELFHGPTSAFKDFGARFLAACLARIPRADDRPLTVLVATSGDTGSAVGSAFHLRPGFRVAVLYPDGLVSPRQAHQLGAFGDNVSAFRVAGTFDDCQRMVKAALVDHALAANVHLTSANSISLGRLLPQMAYYAWAALVHRHDQLDEWGASREPTKLGFIVPTGNLGNALAAIFCREMGVPIGDIVLATNANRVLADFFAGGDYATRPSIATVANAMDVGGPSNFERLRWLVPNDADLRSRFRVHVSDDDQLRASILRAQKHENITLCPHSAAAYDALTALRGEGDARPYAIVCTAHPAKFEAIVEAVLDQEVTLPLALARTLSRTARAVPLAATVEALAERLLDWQPVG